MEEHAKHGSAALCGDEDPEVWMPAGSAAQLFKDGGLPANFCPRCLAKLAAGWSPEPGVPEMVDP